MRQYGLNMITNTLPDPDQMKSNNEVAKAQLKKRLNAEQSPGPGSYDPLMKPPLGANSATPAPQLPEWKRAKD